MNSSMNWFHLICELICTGVARRDCFSFLSPVNVFHLTFCRTFTYIHFAKWLYPKEMLMLVITLFFLRKKPKYEIFNPHRCRRLDYLGISGVERKYKLMNFLKNFLSIFWSCRWLFLFLEGGNSVVLFFPNTLGNQYLNWFRKHHLCAQYSYAS